MDKHMAQLARQERRWMHAVALTALAAVFLMIHGVWLGWPAWGIALAWVILYTPLFLARVLWSSRYYSRMAFFLACLLLLLGRSTQEVVQAWQSLWLQVPATSLELARPMAMRLMTDMTILGVTYIAQMRMHNRWSISAGSVMLVAFVAHTLVCGQAVLAASASLLALIALLIVFVQQIQHIYDAWLARAMTALNDADLIATLAPVKHVSFRASRVIFRQDDKAEQLYLLVRGEVEMLRREPRGVYEPVALLNAGQFFGEVGLLGGARRTTAIKAVTDVECLALDRAAVKTLVSTICANSRDDLVLCCYLAWLGVPKQPAIKDRVPEIEQQAALMDAEQYPSARPATTGLLGSLLSNPPQPMSNPNRDVGQGTLLVMRGAQLQQRIVIDTPQTVVGRYGTQDGVATAVQLDDRHVSPRHLALNIQPDGLYARDLGSAHGTWVDGQQLGILPVRLLDGSEIRLGPNSILCYLAYGTAKNTGNPARIHPSIRCIHASIVSPKRSKGRKGFVSLW